MKSSKTMTMTGSKMGMFKKKKQIVQSEGVVEILPPDDFSELRSRITKTEEYDNAIKQIPEGSKTHDRIKKGKRMSRLKDRFFPERTYLINMELRNGMHTEFIINVKENFFKYMDGTYIIDQEFQHYVISSKTYALDYHQDLPLPIRREIPVAEIQRTLKQLSTIDPEQLTTAMNPHSLDAFIEGRVIEQLMKAQDIDAFFKQMRLIFIAQLIISIIHFLLFIKASGMLSNIQMPF